MREAIAIGLIVGVAATHNLTSSASPSLRAFVCASLGLPGERAALDRGESLLRVLPARDRDLMVAAAVQVRVPAERLAALVERLDHLPKGERLQAAGRFSDIPVLEDLQGLRLPPGDLEELRRCRPGACGVKASDEEIARVQRAIADAGRDWKPAVEQTFKHIMVARLRAFQAQGHAGLRPYHDKSDRVGLEQEFLAVIANAGFLQGTPGLLDYLVRYPRSHTRPFREFFYWSLESLGRKPITSVTRVTMLLPEADAGADAIVMTTQVFATHYVTASISLMAITTHAQAQPGLFVYTNNSRIDGLQGLFGGLVRRTVEGRIRSDGPAVLQELRRRLELSGK